MVTRACRQFDIALLLQLPPHSHFRQEHAKLVMEPPHQIDQPLANNSMDRRDRAAFNDLRKGPTLGIVQQRGLARRLPVEESVRPPGIEAHHPVAHDLQCHAANPRGIAAAPTIINFRQASSRRPWFALLVARASRLKTTASKSARNPIAAPMAMPSNRKP
jgi:hypothetical protein